MALTKEDWIKEIKSMTVVELNDLVEAIKAEFGVTAAVAVGGGAPAAGGAAAAEEKSTFDVILKSAGGNKINVIKAIKEATGLGLKEAKDIADKDGSVVKAGVDKAAADEMKKKLTEAGATVEIK